MLAEWEQVPTPKARGRRGPHSPPIITAPIVDPSPSSSATSTMESLVTVLAASTTIMLNNMMQNSQASGSQQSPLAKRPASPLPNVEDWLHICVRSFGERRKLPEAEITKAITILGKKGYTPYELGNENLKIDRICELTDLTEGVVVGLQSFSKDWVERQTVKRARV